MTSRRELKISYCSLLDCVFGSGFHTVRQQHDNSPYYCPVEIQCWSDVLAMPLALVDQVSASAQVLHV